MRTDAQTDLEDWLAVMAGEPVRRPDPSVAIRRAVELIEIVIDADVDDQLCIVDDGEEVSAFRVLEDLRSVMPVERRGGR